MPTRAQRRRNREGREAVERLEAYKVGLPDLAKEKLGTRREFIAEAVRSSGLISLTFRPRGTANYLDVYGGAITFDGTSRLRGDTIVNDWTLPDIKGFQVRYDKNTALVARPDHVITAIDVSDIWLRTADELFEPAISVAEQGGEEHIAVTRDGLTLLTQTIGHSVLGESLRYIERQIFNPQQLGGRIKE